jgi:hypothetical protein
MPLFKRPDGDLITDESYVRRIMPYLMRGRNESIVLHEEVLDLTRTKLWLSEYNRCHTQPVTLFHLVIWAMGTHLLHGRPGVNRFVSGGRLYQRKGVFVTFSAKKSFRHDSPLLTVKLAFPDAHETFADCVRRIIDAIERNRSDGGRWVDKELRVAMSMPGLLLRGVMAILRGLDDINLLPGWYVAADPMYTSCFVSNLGSIGLDNTYHHLYEYGTASIVVALGSPRKYVCVDEKTGGITSHQGVQMRTSVDERVNDGLYCARAQRFLARVVENPDTYIGPPSLGADKQGRARTGRT